MRMGNKCCRSEKAKEKPDVSNPALQIIREAQMKYFHSHIESDLDDSDEDDDKEDSTDGGLYGSDCSLGEDNSLDNDVMDPALMADGGSALQSTLDITADDISSVVLRSDNINNNDNKGNQIGGDAITPCNLATNAVEGGSSKVTEGKGKHFVKRRHNAKYIRLSSARGNFYSIFNTEDKKARTVDPKMYQYPFENIVFEGGGNKGLAYCGAVRVS